MDKTNRMPLKMKKNGKWVDIGEAIINDDGSILCKITDEDARLNLAFNINDFSVENYQ